MPPKAPGSLFSAMLLCVAIVLPAACHSMAQMDEFPKLPMLHVEGSHYEMGLAIGQTFRQQILEAISNNTFFNDKLLPYNQTDAGSDLYSKYLHTAVGLYPQYLEEIRGMADGVKLPFDELFLWNMLFELGLLLEPRVHHLPPSSCSDLYLVNGTIRSVMGHNEDGSPTNIVNGYMINASLTDGEKFIFYCYPGELCGSAFGYNFVTQTAITVNALFPKTVDTKALGRNFLNRALLSQTYSQIQQTLKEVQCSSGFSLNIGRKVSKGPGLESFSVSNFEVSSLGAMETVINSGYNYHFNMYLHSPAVPQYNDPSSEHRLARIKQLHPAYNQEDILSYLGDTKDDQYPIYRTAAGPDHAATIATALFDLPNSKFYIYRGNPAHTEPVMTIPTS